MSDPLTYQQFIKAPLQEVFHALTNSTRLREWMCDLATTDPKPGGRIYFAWHPGFYACGHFTALEPGNTAAYSWFGRGEIQPTLVTFTLSGQEGGTQLTLVHSGLGEGQEWESIRQNFQYNWMSALENLVSILETGKDLRIVNRPMLGIQLDDFNAEIAQKMGLPITEGVRLSGVVEGMGAQAAGLQANDVLVRIGKFETKDYGTLGYILGAYRAGDEVDVDFYRNGVKETVRMKLAGRPLPEIPATPMDLAKKVSEGYVKAKADLAASLDGVTEEAAAFKLNLSDWSAKETLAHLIHSERDLQNYIQNLAGSYEPIYDDGGNLPARVAATLQVLPNVQDLLAALFRLMDETVALVSCLPAEFIERKSTYWRLGYQLVQDPLHQLSHLEQIKTALNAASSRS
jgi:uncharacterized protein YndB with AHSA1/START domain